MSDHTLTSLTRAFLTWKTLQLRGNERDQKGAINFSVRKIQDALDIKSQENRRNFPGKCHNQIIKAISHAIC